ncbi:hemolysin family protein [Singulisphaera sp. PoT]|uniref:hemolysin family protein n=1 Tax=Singulisphaera sp. PoT TaxID=3411797 RepID=UPI003BF5B9E3
MAALNWGATLILGLLVLAAHLVSVMLAKALRTYSRSRLEALCLARGNEARADEIAHQDVRTELSAETLAVVTGLTLAALLGVTVDRTAPHLANEAIIAIALMIGALGYVLAGVGGRIYAENVIYTLWPASPMLRTATTPLTLGWTLVERLARQLSRSYDVSPRPASVEVEVPAEGGEAEDLEADLPESARQMLQHAIELTRQDISEIITPRSSIVSLPSSISSRGAAATFSETGLSRIPIFGENRDDIVGILYAKDLFPRMTEASDPDTVVPRKLVRPAYCIPETKNAFELLNEFRSKRTQIAIVLDEYGGVSGLITLEDLLEQLVGVIDDEHDPPTPADVIIPVGPGRYEVDATLSLEHLNERLRLHLPTDEDFLTLGGLAFHALGRLPERGASFRQYGVEFTILEVADHTIRRVLVDLQPSTVSSSSN